MNLRSWLFIPGDSDKKLAKADGAGADALILDLEDFGRAGQQGGGARKGSRLSRSASAGGTAQLAAVGPHQSAG